MAGADLVRENSTAGWLADKPSEHNDWQQGLQTRTTLIIIVDLNDQNQKKNQLVLET